MAFAPFPVRSLLGAAFGALLSLSSLSAWADFQSDITVKLIAPGGINGVAPTPINVSQLVTTANLTTGVMAGDGGAIGSGYMLAGEEVTFNGNSIHVRSYSGFDDGAGNFSTGYLGSGADHARYEFDGLSIAGKTIVGLTISAFDNYANSGFIGLASPLASDLAHFIDASTISLDLDSILFVNRGTGSSFAHADFRIDLVTRDANGGGGGGGGNNNLPEPATLALFAIAALGARVARRHA